jgi:hypothetical protein
MRHVCDVCILSAEVSSRLAVLLLLNAQVWRQCRVGTLHQYDAFYTYLRGASAI